MSQRTVRLPEVVSAAAVGAAVSCAVWILTPIAARDGSIQLDATISASGVSFGTSSAAVGTPVSIAVSESVWGKKGRPLVWSVGASVVGPGAGISDAELAGIAQAALDQGRFARWKAPLTVLAAGNWSERRLYWGNIAAVAGRVLLLGAAAGIPAGLIVYMLRRAAAERGDAGRCSCGYAVNDLAVCPECGLQRVR